MLLRQHKDFPSSSDHEIQSCIHYVETVPSVLQDMARVHQVKHKVCVLYRIDSFAIIICVCVLYTIDLHSLVYFIMQLLDVTSLRKEVQNICHQQAVVEKGLKCVEIVYGAAGQ